MPSLMSTKSDRPLPQSCVDCWMHSRSEWRVLDRAGITAHNRSRVAMDFQAGHIIFKQTEESSGVYCVESGHILLRQLDAFGNETAFRLIVQGETVGWRSFFADEPHAATALALTSCRICFIPRKALNELLDKYPHFTRQLLKTLARDRGPAEALLLRSPLLPVNIRLIHLLLILRDRCSVLAPPDGLIFDLPLKRKQIAAMIGTRSETLSRAIRELKVNGVAIFQGRRVSVPDQRRLLEIAHQGTTSPPAN